MPQVKFSFVELGNLETVEPASICDVIGVIKDVGDISQIVSKATQKPVSCAFRIFLLNLTLSHCLIIHALC